MRFENALVSVSDKAGLVEFLKPLAADGTRVVSTGGTARMLAEGGLTVVDVSAQTGFAEVMDGRVKTLHPRVHMALLARPGHAEDEALLRESGLEPFDLVVVNLYPFEQTLAKRADQRELIENIDIGGPSLLRAAAKNFERITVIVDPEDYARLRAAGEVTLEERRRLAAKAFAHVSTYDAMIAHALGSGPATEVCFPLGGSRERRLRYGENPHQRATWYRRRGAAAGLHDAEILQGKELSFNNLLDLDAAVAALRDLEGPSAVAVKHNNPCGAATAAEGDDALAKCLASDPVSVFGGIVAVNVEVTEAMAERLVGGFLECVVAPRFSAGALARLAAKKNLRLLAWPGLGLRDDFPRIATVAGGFLVQQPDVVHPWDSEWTILAEEPPSPATRADLSFAWALAAHLRSNAIAVASGRQTVGLGMGQVNRVDAVDQALGRMRKFHPDVTAPVLASDAFFPFPDSIDLIADAGVRWVIQPGGSVRDDDVFKRARERGVNLVITGRRHFRH